MRIRNIKPGFWTNEDLADCTDRQNLLFIGLWMLADKNGCMEYRPRRIKGQLFALRDYAIDELRSDCRKLAEAGLIHLFRSTTEELPQDFRRTSEVLPQTCESPEEEAEFLLIPNFVKHQQLTTWEKNSSEATTPLPKHFSSTTEVLQPEVAEDTEELKKLKDTEVAEEGMEAASTSEVLRQLEAFRAIHAECEKITETTFVSAVQACTEQNAKPDVWESIQAFKTDFADVSTFRPGSPIREFKKYLRHSCRKASESNTGKKNKKARMHPALQK